MSVKLTETVTQGGCAAKLPAGTLKGVLSSLELRRPPELLVGTEHLDDACLYDLMPSTRAGITGLVQTVDFFTPIVDSPRDFGAIAAANALSDVYAMGGAPKLALSILAFPSATLPIEVVRECLDGANAKLTEAGAVLAGGHTIDDTTLKLGFAVTGFVRPDRAWTNAAARPGDALILTKGLGTGTITTAFKLRECKPEWIQAATASMTLLNAAPELLGDAVEVHAATDITGFGLLGHALQMAQASRVRFEIEVGELPVIAGALECLKEEMLNRAHRSNRDYVESQNGVDATGVPELWRWLSYDPQTSGGLLLSVPEEQAQEAVMRLRERFPMARRIGRVVPAPKDLPRILLK